MFPELAYDDNNGVILCYRCHRVIVHGSNTWDLKSWQRFLPLWESMALAEQGEQLQQWCIVVVVMPMDKKMREMAMDVVERLKKRIRSSQEEVAELEDECHCENAECEYCDDRIATHFVLDEYEATLRAVLAMFPEIENKVPPMPLSVLQRMNADHLTPFDQPIG
jgi:hypothetical protein